jgi:hypothetical protein
MSPAWSVKKIQDANPSIGTEAAMQYLMLQTDSSPRPQAVLSPPLERLLKKCSYKSFLGVTDRNLQLNAQSYSRYDHLMRRARHRGCTLVTQVHLDMAFFKNPLFG